MKEIIGFNLMCAAIAFIIICVDDLSAKGKVIFMVCEIVVLAAISCGAYLIAGV